MPCDLLSSRNFRVNHTKKVLWGEGLFLRPQHFQRQDRYHEDRLHQTAMALHPFAWGVKEVQIDTDALANNLLRVQTLKMICQDGELYSAPDGDDLPDAIDLSEVGAGTQSVTYHAALPALKNFGGNFSSPTSINKSARYEQVNLETLDFFTAAAKAEITYLKKTVRMISDQEPRDAYIAMPIVRLRRGSGAAAFELDPDFMPPSLSIASAPALVSRLRRLSDALHAKVNALHGHHREPSRNVVEFRSGDISSFWLLHTASAACAGLSHYLNHPEFHPERLHEQLLSLTGALMTFSKSFTLNDLPAYHHMNPWPGFAKLDGMIRELLDTVISSRYFSIALSEVRPSYHHAMLDSGKIDEKTSFYLAVNADMPALELVGVVPLRFKIGAPDDVDKFVLAAMPGVKVMHSPQVPTAVPVRPDTYYFLLDNKGATYERMLQAQSMSIYVPSGLRGLRLELLAVTT
jgi:type VI secretion system protein ImpJ